MIHEKGIGQAGRDHHPAQAVDSKARCKLMKCLYVCIHACVCVCVGVGCVGVCVGVVGINHPFSSCFLSADVRNFES